MRYPSIKAVAAELRAINREVRDSFPVEPEEDYCGLDVRLQVEESGAWKVWEGDSSYDTDHRGFWACGTLDGKRFNARDMAREMLEQVREQVATA